MTLFESKESKGKDMEKAKTFKEIKASAEAMRKEYADNLAQIEKALKEAEEKRTEVEAQLKNFNGTPDEYANLYIKLSAFKDYESMMKAKKTDLVSDNQIRNEEFRKLRQQADKAIKANTQNHVEWMRKICTDLLKELKPKEEEEMEINTLLHNVSKEMHVSPFAASIGGDGYDTISKAFETMRASAEYILKCTEK